MKRFSILLLLGILVAACCPPWKITWVDPRTGQPPLLVHDDFEFGGFHSWMYEPQHRARVIDWEGRNGTEQIELKPVAKLWTEFFLLELASLLALAVLARKLKFAPKGIRGRVPSPELAAKATQAINAIEAEMKRVDWWSGKAPEPERMNFHEPFGADTLAYQEWLQFVFIPRVRSIIESKGEFPPNSSVGTKAMREWDYMEHVAEGQKLIRMLNDFDDLVNNR